MLVSSFIRIFTQLDQTLLILPVHHVNEHCLVDLTFAFQGTTRPPIHRPVAQFQLSIQLVHIVRPEQLPKTS